MKSSPCPQIKGRVIHGFHVGNVFGMATANLEILDRSFGISDGVYFVEVMDESRPELGLLSGLLHIGDRMTFGSGFSAEVHLLDFDMNIYGDILKVTVLKRCRNIRQFQNAEELYTQIQKDVIWAKRNIFFVGES